MPVQIAMPKLGLTMTEGLITEWKFKEGDSVKKGDVLFTLETEKVTYEVESPADGVLAKILICEGETVPVGAVVGYITQTGEKLPLPLAPETIAVGKERPTPGELSTETEFSAQTSPISEIEVSAPTDLRIRATPLAKKTARAYGIDLGGVKGSGSHGRIMLCDVEAWLQRQATVPTGIAQPDAAGGDRLVPFSSMRRAIARKMLASKLETAQTYMSLNADASKILECREALLSVIEAKHHVRITVTDIIMKITGAAIKEHPVINTRWTAEGVLFLKDVHMGMAMALEEGLIVPVIRNINDKSFSQISLERTRLIEKGKANKFMPDDISGSTFTVSAMGMFGIEQFTSNINVPECAILAVGTIIKKQVVVHDQAVIRPIMNVTLSYDHRVIDGAEAGKFLRTLKSYFQNPIQIFA
ncbi:MAG: 2-oxo acid dehydrogenase subunit E2 [Desulfobacterales bacterium]|nr:2-oxo acid dehydrogenase subunit E2 [Desulfobacterales bacterium]